MKRILVLTEWFYPAFKAEALISPCSKFIHELSPHHCFYVLTSDHDKGDKTPLTGIVTNQWTNLTHKSVIRYVPGKNMNAAGLKQIIRKINPHAIYINTMLSLRFSLMPLYLLQKTGFTGKIIIAPGGTLQQRHFGVNALKKSAFTFLHARFRSQSAIYFHARDEQEVFLIKKYFGQNTPVTLAVRELLFPCIPEKASKRVSGKVLQ
ncbi:hypothetical protein [Longitalea arenae]|uniref:hypothetical protein n=1 Tax=Longitalea arenae TaxID=2812558 RepID=UPI001967F0F0|nr:hypothetical protein [Longitalea arenae]